MPCRCLGQMHTLHSVFASLRISSTHCGVCSHPVPGQRSSRVACASACASAGPVSAESMVTGKSRGPRRLRCLSCRNRCRSECGHWDIRAIFSLLCLWSLLGARSCSSLERLLTRNVFERPGLDGGSRVSVAGSRHLDNRPDVPERKERDTALSTSKPAIQDNSTDSAQDCRCYWRVIQTVIAEDS